MRKRPAVIFDMDGTLVHAQELRLAHLVPTPERKWKDFNAFHRESVNAPPNPDVVALARAFAEAGLDVIIVTARRAVWRHHTAWWLALHDVPSVAMFMRANDDGRPDYEVKRDILRSIQRTHRIVHAVDDNPHVIRLWAEHGIPTTVIPGWQDN